MSIQAKWDKIQRLKEEMLQAEKDYEEELEKDENWYLTKYPLTIDFAEDGWDDEVLIVQSNYMNYQDAKINNKNDIFSLTIEDKHMHSESNISLTLDTAKQLSDYLLKVISYMEDK